MRNGYAYIELFGECEIELIFDMSVRLVAANRRVHADAGRVAVMRGPVVYCAEGIDNGDDVKSIVLDTDSELSVCESEFLLPSLKTTAHRPPKTDELYSTVSNDYEDIPLTLIPYFAFANRGECEMQVWLLRGH